MNGRRTKKWLWRWQANPLRRHDDVVEAWIVLVVWVVVLVGGTAIGLVTSRVAGDVFAQQRAERHTATAVLVNDVPSTATAGGTSARVMSKVRWTAPDGTSRTGKSLVVSGQQAGARVEVWLDASGTLTNEPPTATEASLEAALLGFAAGAALAGTVFGAGAVARWELDRRRVDEWGREWDLVGPRWGGHKTS
ncbi:Rv1733c family protein [Streptomyces sp. YIM S03343]